MKELLLIDLLLMIGVEVGRASVYLVNVTSLSNSLVREGIMDGFLKNSCRAQGLQLVILKPRRNFIRSEVK